MKKNGLLAKGKGNLWSLLKCAFLNYRYAMTHCVALLPLHVPRCKLPAATMLLCLHVSGVAPHPTHTCHPTHTHIRLLASLTLPS